ncbi:MAG TPA: sigma-54 dependent transcriptional regulator [Myxococcota bacterium]|nr:sigma-54 dependent transcriptional regulator [Myxococcota bacterium]HRY94003.1 sigma-54 dependent transcriptional regulator [Myxococcota bacterium]
MKPVILVVDDDAGVRYTLRQVLEDAALEVHEAGDGEAALAWLAERRADLIITDLAMPRMDGMALLERVREQPGPPPVVVITAHGSERHAVEAIKRGALDYFSKPFDIELVVKVIERAVASLRRDAENEQLRAELHLARFLVFASPAMSQVALLVHRVAPKDVSVLVTGPSGTGKERVCEALVAASYRAAAPFVRFNCAAVPRELAESELFGYARGAFTGAVRSRKGLFREAHGGSLLLDEVGELDLATQGKLLRVLQEGRVRPVGEDQEEAVDVRVLAATHRSLQEEVRAGRFREDLFYRLHVVRIHLPPLSERPEDIPPLIDHFLRKHAERFGLGEVRLTPEVRDQLRRGVYPGNVRELEHRIERLVALSPGGDIQAADLQAADATSGQEEALGLKERVEAFEKGLLAAELRRTGGNRSEAARRLRIGRVTLLDKLRKYGLPADGRDPPEDG